MLHCHFCSKGYNFCDFLFASMGHEEYKEIAPAETTVHLINPTELRKAKIVCNFGLSECNRLKWRQNMKIAELVLLKSS